MAYIRVHPFSSLKLNSSYRACHYRVCPSVSGGHPLGSKKRAPGTGSWLVRHFRLGGCYCLVPPLLPHGGWFGQYDPGTIWFRGWKTGYVMGTRAYPLDSTMAAILALVYHS